MRRHLTIPNVLATLLLFAVMAQTAPAAPVRDAVAKLITGKQIKDGSLTGADVKDRSLTAKKLAPSITAGPKGPPGTDGAKGAAGEKGATGEPGAPGTFRSSGDARDLYAWIPQTRDTLNVVATFGPSQNPAQALSPMRFEDDVAYEIHIARGPTDLDDIATFQLRFTTAAPRGSRFLRPEVERTTQRFTVRRVVDGVAGPVRGPFPVAPPRIGPRTDEVVRHVHDARQQTYDDAFAAGFTQPVDGFKVWTGPRDDPAFADTGAMADLYNLRSSSSARDAFAKHNVMAIALEIPTTTLTAGGTLPGPTPGTDNMLGLWASTSRMLDGAFRQVSRTSQPMLEDLMIPTVERARFGSTRPKDDIGFFSSYLLDPLIVNELAAVGLYGQNNMPPHHLVRNRTDLLDAWSLTHVPTRDAHPGVSPSTMLRLDPAVDSAWPNGRRLSDDAYDRMFSLIALGDPSQITDNVNANDKPSLPTIPWAPLPWLPSEG